MKQALFLLLAVLAMSFYPFSKTDMADDLSCGQPRNVQKTSSTSTSVTYTWGNVIGATGYVVKYVRLSDGYTSPETNTVSLNLTLTGLTPGAYQFYFATKCGSEVSDFIVIEDVLMG